MESGRAMDAEVGDVSKCERKYILYFCCTKVLIQLWEVSELARDLKFGC